MLPEVERFCAKIDMSRETCEKARDTYHAAFADNDVTREASYRAYREACVTRRNTRDAAWDELNQSDNALVRFIAENCVSHRDEARLILEALPCTLEEMQRIAERENWCSTWSYLLDDAMAAGVIPGHTLSTGRRHLRAYLRDEWEVGSAGVSRIMGLVDQILAEETAQTDENESVASESVKS